MKKDAVITGAAAMILATGIALSAKALFSTEEKPVHKVVEQTQPADHQILVVSRDIRPGEFIDGATLGWKSVPSDDIKPFYLERSSFKRSTLLGVTVRKSMQSGDVLTQADIIRAGDPGFLATVLMPGRRAVSIPTSAVESSFGLVAAGDHVDVILSLSASGGSSKEGSTPFLRSQTILENARVLALNNLIDSLAPGAEMSGDSPRKKAPRSFSTVTLEVTPAMAERLTIAKELGDLVLALRPIGSEEKTTAPNSVTTVAQTTEIYRPNNKVIHAYRGDQFEQIPVSD